MMRNFNNVIKKNDYERYEIIIPFLSAAGKRRKQFLNNELEKLHPCFSDEFAFDSKIAKININLLNMKEKDLFLGLAYLLK